MKYTSEIIHEIIETEGHIAPSTFHYESECKEEWIKEIKGAYPKLTDYEGEWLNYYLENDGIGEFPYLAFTNMTQATVENCVPIPFKTAILKGLTLLNIKGEKSNDNPTNEVHRHDFLIPLVKKNTDYLIKYATTLSGGVLALGFLNNKSSWSNNLEEQPNIGLIRLNSGESPYYFRITGNKGETVSIKNLMILEYQDGMENWNIPYFEGMQSVKMPVLTTTGKNLFSNEFELHGLSVDKLTKYENGFKASSYIELKAAPYQIYQVKPNTNYTFSMSIPTGNGYLRISDYYSNKDLSVFFGGNNNEKSYKTTFRTISDKIKIELFGHKKTTGNTVELIDIQLEEDSSKTSYEPFKSNILSTSEDVTLRRIGNVKDTLDCLTGQVTQRIGEIVLDGSDDENWIKFSSADTTVLYAILLVNPKKKMGVDNVFCDRFTTKNTYNNGTNNESIFGSASNQTVYIRVNKNKIATEDVNALKTWLSQNPITIQYQLETESIKTVELSVVNQDGQHSNLKPFEGTTHIQTNGQPIKPLLDIEVPVEAITQNLESFIEEE